METQTKKKATVRAVVVEIYCPHCEDDDPIPAKNGSFLWDEMPGTVTCPTCKRVLQVGKRVTF